MLNWGCSLVTGGGGFIGAHLVRQLLEQEVLELEDVSLPSDVKVIRAPLTGIRLAARSMFFESNKAVQKLDFQQSLIRQALIDQIEWLVKEGYVTRTLSLHKNM